MVARYRSVLSVPGSPALIVSALLARLPLGMYSLAFLLLVRETHHSYAVAGLTVGAYAFCNAASAPLEGRLVDRFGRARVLPPFALGRRWYWSGSCLRAPGTRAMECWWSSPACPER